MDLQAREPVKIDVDTYLEVIQRYPLEYKPRELYYKTKIEQTHKVLDLKAIDNLLVDAQDDVHGGCEFPGIIVIT